MGNTTPTTKPVASLTEKYAVQSPNNPSEAIMKAKRNHAANTGVHFNDLIARKVQEYPTLSGGIIEVLVTTKTPTVEDLFDE